MAAPRRRGENPTGGESAFQDRLDTSGHRDTTPGIVRLAVLNLDLSVSDVLRAETKALFRSESAIEQDSRNVGEQCRVDVLMHRIGPGGGEVQRLFLAGQDSLAMALAGDHADGRERLLDPAPFRREVEHSAERLKFTIDAADLDARATATGDECRD